MISASQFYFVFGLSLIITIGMTGCENITRKYSYPQSPTFSRPNGEPNDTLTFFFPASLRYSDSIILTNLDTFRLNWYSSQLFPSKEKILFNYYLGQDTYRFTWLWSFANPVFITLNRKDERVWLTAKKLDRTPTFMTTHVLSFIAPKVGSKKRLGKRSKEVKTPYPQVIPPKRNADIETLITKELSMLEWKTFEKKLKSANFWQTSPTPSLQNHQGSMAQNG